MKKEKESGNEYAQEFFGCKSDFFLHLDDEFVSDERRERYLNMSERRYENILRTYAEIKQIDEEVKKKIWGE